MVMPKLSRRLNLCNSHKLNNIANVQYTLAIDSLSSLRFVPLPVKKIVHYGLQ